MKTVRLPLHSNDTNTEGCDLYRTVNYQYWEMYSVNYWPAIK